MPQMPLVYPDAAVVLSYSVHEYAYPVAVESCKSFLYSMPSLELAPGPSGSLLEMNNVVSSKRRCCSFLCPICVHEGKELISLTEAVTERKWTSRNRPAVCSTQFRGHLAFGDNRLFSSSSPIWTTLWPPKRCSERRQKGWSRAAMGTDA